MSDGKAAEAIINIAESEEFPGMFDIRYVLVGYDPKHPKPAHILLDNIRRMIEAESTSITPQDKPILDSGFSTPAVL